MAETEEYPSYWPQQWRGEASAHARRAIEAAAAGALPPPDLRNRLRCVATTVEMRDGTRIAVDIWLPEDSAEPRPAVVVTTRYWRARLPAGPAAQFDDNRFMADAWIGVGYALVLVDARGSGASTGCRAAEWSDAEIADSAEIIEWVAAQEWCDGDVVTEGASYAGNTAALAAVHAPPSLKAIVARYADFDPYCNLAYPGGVHNAFMIAVWGLMTGALDHADLTAIARMGGPAAGPKPVDEDPDGVLLAAALAEHAGNFNVAAAGRRVEYIDDPFGLEPGKLVRDTGLCAHLPALRGQAVSQQVWASWLDAGTADGALQYYAAMPDAPITVRIGAWSHASRFDCDPFDPQTPRPLAQAALVTEYARFFRTACAPGPPPRREICYVTIGTDEWRATPSWPPPGTIMEEWYLQTGQGFAPVQPGRPSEADVYLVSSSATTGTSNRWRTQVGGGPVLYPDRALRDADLLCYTSTPLGSAVEITGHPVITLHLSSSAPDFAVFVYLEAVRPDGRVIYLTEGVFRALHRRLVPDEARVPWIQGPQHSFRREHAHPLTPDEPAEIAFALLPVAARLQPRDRLRVAIAGADADTFAYYPTDPEMRWTIHRGGSMASRLTLPLRPPLTGSGTP